MAACGMRCAATQSPGHCSFWCFTPHAEESRLFSPSPPDGGGRVFSSTGKKQPRSLRQS
jgi:hypothetical protein